MNINMSRRDFFELLGAGAAAAALPGCCSMCGCGGVNAKIALQLYSIKDYIGGVKDKAGKVVHTGVGLDRALEDVAAIGFKGVEFAGGYYKYDKDAKGLRKALANSGVKACGTHVSCAAYGLDTKAWTYDSDVLKKTCEFNMTYGNNLIINPGGGNFPPGCSWSTGRGGEPCKPSQAIDDHTKKLAEFYNKKYPHRSPTLHAKENGMGKGVVKFDAILGQPGCDANGKPCATPVDWDGLIPVTEKDGVEWYVVECERHFEDLSAVTPSYAFLKAKGLN